MNHSKNQFKCKDLLEEFPDLLQKAEGDLNQTFSEVTEWNSATSKSIIFVSKRDDYEKALTGAAAVIITQLSFVGKKTEKTVLVTKNIGLTQALVTEKFFGRYKPQDECAAGIHPSAVVASSAHIGEHVFVGPNAVIGERVSLENNCYVGAGCVIEDNSKIGKNTRLWPKVFVGCATVIGDDCVIHPNSTIGSEGYGFSHDEKGRHFRIPQLGNVVLQNRVEIGANCTIDRAAFKSTVIGEGTKIDNLVHIAHNCTIGKNCIITGGFIMGGSSHLGDNVVIGGSVTMTDHVRVASNVRISGLSGISKSITEAGDYGGYPLQQIKDHLKTISSLAKLPEIRRRLTDLESKKDHS